MHRRVHLSDALFPFQRGQREGGTLQGGKTDVGGLSADHILTGQSAAELDLLRSKPHRKASVIHRLCGVVLHILY